MIQILYLRVIDKQPRSFLVSQKISLHLFDSLRFGTARRRQIIVDIDLSGIIQNQPAGLGMITERIEGDFNIGVFPQGARSFNPAPLAGIGLIF